MRKKSSLRDGERRYVHYVGTSLAQWDRRHVEGRIAASL
jgi:hypothetical protein